MPRIFAAISFLFISISIFLKCHMVTGRQGPSSRISVVISLPAHSSSLALIPQMSTLRPSQIKEPCSNILNLVIVISGVMFFCFPTTFAMLWDFAVAHHC